MGTTTLAVPAGRTTGPSPAAGVMFTNTDRVFYVGRLGHPGQRVIGAITLYVSAEGLLDLSVQDTRLAPSALAVIPPYAPHHIHATGQDILCVLIEPEFLDPARLPAILRGAADPLSEAACVQRVRDAAAELLAGPADARLSNDAFDTLVLGQPLATRELDPRIAEIVQTMRDDPTDNLSAAEGASRCQVSPSRFMHLFKEEVGCSLRNFRMWKRARCLLPLVKSGMSLTHIAVDLGYYDSSYFSNSIRFVTGLRPRDIIEGSRKLKLLQSVD